MDGQVLHNKREVLALGSSEIQRKKTARDDIFAGLVSGTVVNIFLAIFSETNFMSLFVGWK